MRTKPTALPARAQREAGLQTRQSLIEAASRLFLSSGFDAVSVAEIARAVDAFPNQVTHHFGGKEMLFVEAASHAVLRAAKQAERVTRDTPSIEVHTRKLIAQMLGPGAPAVMMFAEAMLMSRRRPALASVIAATLARLHEAGEAAMLDTLRRTGWETRADEASISRSFWAAIFGLVIEKAAAGSDFDYSSAEAVALVMMNLDRHFQPST